MKTFSEYLIEHCPPGMEGWVADHVDTFKEAHGENWEAALMAAAWSVYRRAYIAPFVGSQ